MKDLALKLGSLLVAMIIWIITFNVSDSVVTATRDIELKTINEQVMQESKLDYSLNESYVTVSFKARTQALAGITSNDFNAYVDLSQVSKSGAAEVYVDILNGKEGIIADVEVKPYIVGVYTEEIQTKDFTLVADTIGEPKDSYQVRNVTLGDETVTLSGPASEIGRISSAKVEIDIDRIKGAKSGEQEIVFYDSNNNKIDLENTKVQANRVKTTYNVEVYKSKEVELHATVVGKPTDGKIYTSFNILPGMIKIAGLPEVIDSIETIDLGIIDITNKSEGYIEKVNINSRLPEGVELGSLVNTANISINIVDIDIEAILPTTSEADETPSEAETTENTEIGPGVSVESEAESEETTENENGSAESIEETKETNESKEEQQDG